MSVSGVSVFSEAASNSWKRLEFAFSSQIKVWGAAGWTRAMLTVAAAGGRGCRRISPKTKRPTTTRNGRMISDCQAKRDAGFWMINVTAEKRDSEVQATMNEMP